MNAVAPAAPGLPRRRRLMRNALARLRRGIPEPLPITLDRRRIYILPTGFGLSFAAILCAMAVGALNFGNNAALLMTSLLAAASAASLFMAFRALHRVTLAGVDMAPCHAGEPIAVTFRFAPPARGHPSLLLGRRDDAIAFRLPVDREQTVARLFPSSSRGWWRTGPVTLATEYPLGLFRAWSRLNPDVRFVVFPAVEVDAPPLPGGRHGIDATPVAGVGDEPSGLRAYRAGDPPRLIAWKPSARHDKLLVREGERTAESDPVLDYATLGGLAHEARISRLAAWVLAADASGRNYTLVLPGERFGPSGGLAHRLACLSALALLP